MRITLIITCWLASTIYCYIIPRNANSMEYQFNFTTRGRPIATVQKDWIEVFKEIQDHFSLSFQAKSSSVERGANLLFGYTTSLQSYCINPPKFSLRLRKSISTDNLPQLIFKLKDVNPESFVPPRAKEGAHAVTKKLEVDVHCNRTRASYSVKIEDKSLLEFISYNEFTVGDLEEYFPVKKTLK